MISAEPSFGRSTKSGACSQRRVQCAESSPCATAPPLDTTRLVQPPTGSGIGDQSQCRRDKICFAVKKEFVLSQLPQYAIFKGKREHADGIVLRAMNKEFQGASMPDWFNMLTIINTRTRERII